MDSAARWTARLEIIAPLTLFACGLWAFVFTPTETEQGFVQKIMYIHVPSVIVTYLAFFVTFSFGIAYLWKRLLVFDRIAKVSAEIGLIFCAMVLFSGAIWGRPTWGTYWVWDARLTSFLVLFFIYLGLKLIKESFSHSSKGDYAFAYLALIGGFNLPIIKFSVDWWNTLHQPASILRTGGVSISSEMLIPLFLMAVGFLCIFIYVLLVSVEIDLKKRKISNYKKKLSN